MNFATLLYDLQQKNCYHCNYSFFDTGRDAWKSYRAKKITEGQIAKDIIRSRSIAENSTEKSIESLQNFLKSYSQIENEIGYSKTDNCERRLDSAFFNSTWYQSCYLLYVKVFTTSSSIQEATTLLNEKEALQYLPNYARPSNVIDCTIISSETLKIVYISKDPSNNCSFSEQNSVISELYKDQIVRNTISTKQYETFDPQAIPREEDQIWFTYRNNYFSGNIGCDVGFIDCKPPYSEIIHP